MRFESAERSSERIAGKERELAKKCAALKIVDTLELLQRAATVPGQPEKRDRETLLVKSSSKRRHCHIGDHTRSSRPSSATGNGMRNHSSFAARYVALLVPVQFPLPASSSSSSSSAASVALAASWCGAKLQQAK